MKSEDEFEEFIGKSEESFAEAARRAVEIAEVEFDRRGEDFPTEYDVRLRVTAHGPLGEYHVLLTPSHGGG